MFWRSIRTRPMVLGEQTLSGHSAGPLEWKLTAVEVWTTIHPISLYGGERTFRSGRRNGDGRQRGRSRPRDLRRRIPKDHQDR